MLQKLTQIKKPSLIIGVILTVGVFIFGLGYNVYAYPLVNGDFEYDNNSNPIYDGHIVNTLSEWASSSAGCLISDQISANGSNSAWSENNGIVCATGYDKFDDDILINASFYIGWQNSASVAVYRAFMGTSSRFQIETTVLGDVHFVYYNQGSADDIFLYMGTTTDGVMKKIEIDYDNENLEYDVYFDSNYINSFFYDNDDDQITRFDFTSAAAGTNYNYLDNVSINTFPYSYSGIPDVIWDSFEWEYWIANGAGKLTANEITPCIIAEECLIEYLYNPDEIGNTVYLIQEHHQNNLMDNSTDSITGLPNIPYLSFTLQPIQRSDPFFVDYFDKYNTVMYDTDTGSTSMIRTWVKWYATSTDDDDIIDLGKVLSGFKRLPLINVYFHLKSRLDYKIRTIDEHTAFSLSFEDFLSDTIYTEATGTILSFNFINNYDNLSDFYNDNIIYWIRNIIWAFTLLICVLMVVYFFR